MLEVHLGRLVKDDASLGRRQRGGKGGRRKEGRRRKERLEEEEGVDIDWS